MLKKVDADTFFGSLRIPKNMATKAVMNGLKIIPRKNSMNKVPNVPVMVFLMTFRGLSG